MQNQKIPEKHRGRWETNAIFSYLDICHDWDGISPSDFGICHPWEDRTVMAAYTFASSRMEAWEYHIQQTDLDNAEKKRKKR